MKYSGILIALMTILSVSCTRSVMFEDKATVVGVTLNCRTHKDAKHKKYEVILDMSNINTFDERVISFLTDSLYSVGDTIYFGKHY